MRSASPWATTMTGGRRCRLLATGLGMGLLHVTTTTTTSTTSLSLCPSILVVDALPQAQPHGYVPVFVDGRSMATTRKMARLFWNQRASMSSFPSSSLSLSMTSVKVYFDSSQAYHRDLNYHPEQPARIATCVQALQHEFSKESVQLVDVAPASLRSSSLSSASAEAENIAWEPFSDDELAHARRMLVEVHSEEYVSNIEQRCEASKRRRVEEGKNPWGYIGYVDGGDTYLTTESYGVLLRATAIWIRAVSQSQQVSFCLTRPPGHHATRGTANGFCVFNFAAAATRHAVSQPEQAHVSVMDWDVHYGQGVTDILRQYQNNEARYVSIHQSPAFPYEGTKMEIVGNQNIKTIPVPPGITWETGYREAFVEQLLPFLLEKEPSLVLVCAGYDALASDPLANVNLNAADYRQMTQLLLEHYRNSGRRGGLVFGLEGGYQLSESSGDSLAQAVMETIRGLMADEK